ncbi:MAG: abortive infection family protein [Gammaproteobacteria bacterium]|nr:abortive infection family protein [Gammaproteobacteria bacterium]MYK47564.1 abortive infection family protein [Gammaproteobacteria bacterium]
MFVRIEGKREQVEDLIRANLETVLGAEAGFLVNVEIALLRPSRPGSTIPDGRISRRTQAAILDEMRARGTVWNGALDDMEFLGRIFDLKSMPSHDSRFDTAEGDIWQHRFNNDDWPQDWVFTDERFGLYDLEQGTFLKFVAEVLHPGVRIDATEQAQLAIAFNDHLGNGGWQLVEDMVLDGRPTYVAERKVHGLGNSVRRIKAVAASLGSGNLYEDLRRLEHIGDTEPGEAIGLAKEIVESCCKLILDDRNVPYPETADIPKLLKLLRGEIEIMPQGIRETAKASNEIRDVLTSLGKIAHALGPIRNAYGKGHGRGRNFKGLEPRHARLAIGAASTFVDFVLDRHRDLATRQRQN